MKNRSATGDTAEDVAAHETGHDDCDCLNSRALVMSGLRNPREPLSREAEGSLILTQTHASLRSSEADEKAVFWARFSAICGTVTILAIAFSAWQFYDQRQTWKIEQSLAFIRQGNSDPVSGATLSLASLYGRYAESQSGQPFIDYAREKDDRTVHYYDVVINYWQQIAICADRLCDRDVLAAYIGPGDAPMFEHACPLILEYRAHAPSYAKEAEDFLGVECGTVEARLSGAGNRLASR